jgi:hypothetical protein
MLRATTRAVPVDSQADVAKAAGPVAQLFSVPIKRYHEDLYTNHLDQTIQRIPFSQPSQHRWLHTRTTADSTSMTQVGALGEQHLHTQRVQPIMGLLDALMGQQGRLHHRANDTSCGLRWVPTQTMIPGS